MNFKVEILIDNYIRLILYIFRSKWFYLFFKEKYRQLSLKILTGNYGFLQPVSLLISNGLAIILYNWTLV